VDALHAEFVRRGARIDYGLCDQPHDAENLVLKTWMATTLGLASPSNELTD
jgi:hypothetical protein